VSNPSDGQVFDSISRGGAHEIDLAVKAARAALSGPWGAMSLTDKGRILVKISQKILDHEEELTQLEARDTGKPMTTARNDIKVLARYFNFTERLPTKYTVK
jgi:aldehyde dehydrogenase (NAD+)